MNIFVLNKGGSKIGVLSNQGAKPPAPFFDDLFTQELETGADTYYFSSISNSSTESLFAIGNKIMFEYNNKQRLFTIASIEYEHKEGQKIIGVYAEGIGFELLDIFMEKPKLESNNEPGNDSDLDGDDDYDDEYGDPDDVWIDADGNIVYIKNRNEGGDDYGSPDDVWIDEDGNICYKKNRNDRDRDSLEIKQLSYPNFLNLILKNTGWSYECQPGLEKNKQDMNIRYNTNIYAILQDSMQTYQGVELEFIYEYNNGSIKRVVKAYKNGGRGSKTGKRLQYGVNVRGITKMQEIVDEKEEDVVYEGIATINGHQVQLTYDVDIALKSMDVESMRIGDGYTVIDHDFRPAIEFAARIGKIEISFSDPTMNKCYIANFKQIKGAVSENGGTDEEDVKDLIEDAIGETDIGEHTHDRLVLEEDDSYQVYLTKDGIIPCLLPTTDDFRLGFDGNRWFDIWSRFATLSDTLTIESENGDIGTYADTSIELRQYSGTGFTNLIESKRITITTDDDAKRWLSMGLDNIKLNTGLSRTMITPEKVDTIRVNAVDLHIDFDASSIVNTKLIETEGLPGTIVSEEGDGARAASTSISKKDLLNFILNDVKLYDLEYDVVKKIDPDGEEMYLGIIHSDYFNGHSVSPVGERIFRCSIPKYDSNNDGEIDTKDPHIHTYNLNALVCALIGAFQQYALTQAMDYATVDYVKKSVDNVDAWTNALQVVSEGDEGIEPLAGTADKINGGYIMDGTLKGSQVSKSGTNNILTTTDIVDSVTSTSTNKPASAAAVKKAYDKAVQALNNSGGSGEECRFNDFFTYDDTAYYGANSLLLNEPLVVTSLFIDGDENNGLIVMGDSIVEMSNIYGVSSITFADGTEMTTAGSSGNSNGGLSSDALEVINGKLHIKLPVNFEDSANFSYCGIINGKSNLTGITELDAMTIYCANINPVYDGSGVVKIHGDLEVTGNLITSSHATANIDLLEEQQETISALQNTVQQQQETIAALEARLARIEQYLDLGDDI